jgi:hybrid cluster-associated redox disulfide protein
VDKDVVLSPDDVVATVMGRWPKTLHVFIERRMACPGCPMMHFMTLSDAAHAYGMTVDDLIEALEAACRE